MLTYRSSSEQLLLMFKDIGITGNGGISLTETSSTLLFSSTFSSSYDYVEATVDLKFASLTLAEPNNSSQFCNVPQS